MRLLLDTHVLIGLSRGGLDGIYPAIASGLARGGHDVALSVVSLWEIAIKTRLGKLEPGVPPAHLAAFFEAAGFMILLITHHHVVAEVSPEPPTRDPFDRLLLGQCRIEKRYLVTVDQALRDHPFAARFP
ncbi:type II toxin-antitoxin system VapC family toxin [Methylobacterium sp. J-090]|uniref:type II toxin-antitoxin system VapC family toxin n=1 Tax=Methylobacterium sp. J-090 TaxID=2836666 RepID=UPI001FBA7C20|nr:type II toxin-antitoxin system VapC family toxin [Methylobacterium sp. J-090]MCJ2082922.1 type II toxin-antitoxin system VapC family toxin [Methylobacterium sp. J-090]